MPVGHSFTPPGTVCASCHNSIIAVPLQSVVPTCITPNPNSMQLPTLRTTAAISGASFNGSSVIAAGSTVSTTAPTLQGTISTMLLTGQTLRVLRNGAAIGDASVNSSNLQWTFTDATAPNGAVSYAVRVEALPTFGAKSNTFSFTIDTIPPTTMANLSGASGAGGPIADTGFTTDTRPTVSGTLSVALTPGDVVQVRRNGMTIGAASVTTVSNWTYQEATALALGDYTYTARVVDAAGNPGAIGSGWTVRVTSLPVTTITQVLDSPGGSVLPSVTADTTPTLNGTVTPAPTSPQIVRVLRNGMAVGTATVNGTTWTFNDNILPAPVSGPQTYTARAEVGTLTGVSSAGYVIFVDAIAPPEVASVTGIFDRFVGAVPPGGSTTDGTPQISGTLTSALNAVANASTETLQVLRSSTSGTIVLNAAITFPTATTWNVTDPGPLVAGNTYTYSARVIDAAGNLSAAGGTRAATYDATTRTALISAALNLSNGASIASGTSSFTSATSIRLSGSVSATLLTGQVVRVWRNGTALIPGTATMNGLQWSYDEVNPPNGALSYTVRVESSGAASTFSPAYTFTVDTIAPAQTFTFAVFSNVTPNSTLAGAVPANSSIAAGGTTNDPRPTIQVTLSGALASGETLVIRRVLNGVTTVISPTVSSCTGTNCFQFREAADVISIPAPNATPPTNSPNSTLPTGGSAQYRVSVRDAALNETVTPGTFSFTFDYFTCNQARATNTAANAPTPSVHTTISNAAVNCSSCHGPFNAGGTPAGTFIPVPRTTATYWCRRP